MVKLLKIAKTEKSHYWWIILAVGMSIFGFILALYFLRSQLVFGYDQARDAFEAYSIWAGHHLKVLGPTTDLPGISHGVLWYYFLAFVYFLSKDISSGAFLSLLIFFFSVPLVGFVSAKIFKNTQITALTVSLYVLSPLFQVFSRWLSNPSLALLVTPALLLFLWRYLNGPTSFRAVLVGLSFGLLIQTDFAFCLLLLLLPVYIWYFKVPLKWKSIALFTSGLILTTSSYFIAEIKFGWQGIGALFKVASQNGTNPGASEVLLTIFNRIFDIFSVTILPWPKLITMVFLVVVIVILYRFRSKVIWLPINFFLIWFFGLIILQIIPTAVAGTAHVWVLFIFPLAVVSAYCLYFLYTLRRLTILLILPIFLGQIVTLFHWKTANYSPLSVQRGMLWTDEKSLVDYTYREANGQPFIINSVTNPLYINTTWAYLYEFYGNKTYGYLPFWDGRSQLGRLGSLPQKTSNLDKRFLIIEDSAGIPDFYRAKTIYEEDQISDLVEEKSFGNLIVQRRLFHPNKRPVPLPEALKNVSGNLLRY